MRYLFPLSATSLTIVLAAISAGCATSKTDVAAPGTVYVSDEWYPRRADGTKNEGVAEVYVCIAATGSVEGATLLKSTGHQDLDSAALSIMEQGRYKAGTQDGKHAEKCKTYRLTFSAKRSK